MQSCSSRFSYTSTALAVESILFYFLRCVYSWQGHTFVPFSQRVCRRSVRSLGGASGRSMGSPLVRASSENRHHRAVPRPGITSERISERTSSFSTASARRLHDLRCRTGKRVLRIMKEHLQMRLSVEHWTGKHISFAVYHHSVACIFSCQSVLPSFNTYYYFC